MNLKYIVLRITAFIVTFISLYYVLNDNDIIIYPLIIYASIYVIYSMLETKTSVIQSDGNTVYYKWTRILMLYSWTALILASILNYIFIKEFNNTVMTAGIIISVSGIILRIKSKIILGEYFKEDIKINKNNTVVNKGVYKYIRHPGYAGSILQSIGMPLILNSNYCLFISLIFVISTFIRIHFEEQILSKELSGYKEYMQKTKRIIPYII